MTIPRQKVYDAIDAERLYQTKKYGNHHDRALGLADFILVIEEELAEAKREFVRNGRVFSLREVLQVAAVCVACLEMHGVEERP